MKFYTLAPFLTSGIAAVPYYQNAPEGLVIDDNGYLGSGSGALPPLESDDDIIGSGAVYAPEPELIGGLVIPELPELPPKAFEKYSNGPFGIASFNLFEFEYTFANFLTANAWIRKNHEEFSPIEKEIFKNLKKKAFKIHRKVFDKSIPVIQQKFEAFYNVVDDICDLLGDDLVAS